MGKRMMKKTMTIKSYSELVTLETYEERFEYLLLDGTVGEITYGYQRWINQNFYHSRDWLEFRDCIIMRDLGRDMALAGYEIEGEPVIVHHINPITFEDLLEHRHCVLDPENAVCLRDRTHKALHYGNLEYVKSNLIVERTLYDTCPWKKQEN